MVSSIAPPTPSPYLPDSLHPNDVAGIQSSGQEALELSGFYQFKRRDSLWHNHF